MILSLMQKLNWLSSIKAWVAISHFVRGKVTRGWRVGAGFVHAPLFLAAASSLSRQSEQTQYLFLGRLIEAKGLFPLLDAWKILERQRFCAAARDRRQWATTR